MEKVKVKVVPCEIYSRVVGYFRPVQNWNAGKQQEFSERKTVKLDSFRELARRACCGS
ncbi:anaerobic ribonucleoside-triphosphate reductase [Thermosulfurimonas sp.]|uniref:anaerobic ribonucleoside-triphosphate reductase n=1 Tax=Thermosulfurimonas sp. TaxID=2080236 RepID=UPI0025FBFAF8|nr:anaerobic ribonucleoside-triphosphate reductase [Thermosulfurimonas sp.]